MSGFRINTNVNALSAQSNLGEVNRGLAKSMEKLSSGLRINRAADDAAGLAISERFRSQANGINQAIKNIQEGISLLQVAEGGLSTIGDMVQRIRSLAIQAANDTLTDADRLLVQEEVDQLLEEIDRQGNTVSFNNKQLLAGGFAGTSSTMRTFDSSGVVRADSRPNYYRTLSAPDMTLVPPNQGLAVEFDDGSYTLVSGSDFTTIGVIGIPAASELAFRFQFHPNGNENLVTGLTFNYVGGSDITDAVYGDGPPGNVLYQLYDFQASQWVTVGNNNTGIGIAPTAGNTIAQTANVSRFFDSQGDVWAQAFVDSPGVLHEILVDYVSLDVQSRSEGLIIQAGPNQGDTIEILLPDARQAALGLTGLSVATRTAAEAAITTASNALTRINGSRAEIGAYQNRLENTLRFAGVQRENQSAAESRIRDLDFADEIIAFTKQQILQQAGVSALAQANVAPQSVLQLLQ